MIRKVILCFVFAFLISGILFLQDALSRNLGEEEELILVGIGAFKDGFYDIAEKQFANFVRDYPNHGKIYEICYLLGKTLLIRGKLEEAKAVFLKIINENKNFEYLDYAFFWTAEVERRLDKGEEAKKLLLSIIERYPEFEWIDYTCYLLGYLELGSNKLVQAESFFKKATLLSRNSQIVRSSVFWLGILSYKRNDYEAAIGYFETIREDPKFLPQEYMRYVLFGLGEAQLKLGRFNDARLNYKTFYERFKNDPLVPEVYWKLGFCEYRLGNRRDSIDIFQSFRNQSKDPQLLLYTQYLLGEIFLVDGNYASSIKELSLITNKPQKNILWEVSFLPLYWDYIHLGEKEEANRIFQRVQKLDHFEDEKMLLQWLNAEMIFSEGRISDSLPYFFNVVNTMYREKALFQIGRGYFFENKLREAITNLDILLLEFPNSNYLEESLFIKGECLVKLGNLGHALETYDLILRQDGDNLWQLFALTQVGNIYLFRNEGGKAENTFKKIINSFPAHPLRSNAAFQLGNLYFRKNSIAEAIHYYSTVLKGNTLELFGEVYFCLGEVFYQQGKYDKALASFETATGYLKDTSPWFFLTHLEIGNLQRRAGQYEEAKRSYMIIVDHSKDEEINRAAKELLTLLEF